MQVKVMGLGNDVGYDSDSLVVCDDISSRIEQIKDKGSFDLEDDNVSSTLHGTVSAVRRQRKKCLLRGVRHLRYRVIMSANSCIHSSMKCMDDQGSPN